MFKLYVKKLMFIGNDLMVDNIIDFAYYFERDEKTCKTLNADGWFWLSFPSQESAAFGVEKKR